MSLSSADLPTPSREGLTTPGGRCCLWPCPNPESTGLGEEPKARSPVAETVGGFRNNKGHAPSRKEPEKGRVPSARSRRISGRRLGWSASY